MRLAALACMLAACSSSSAPSTSASKTPAAKPAAKKGTVVTKRFRSEALGVEKNYIVYLPAAYETRPTTRWPVLYYLHGFSVTETASVQANLPEAADALGLEAIIVMPDGDDDFYVDAVTSYDYDACLANGTGLAAPDRPRAETCVRTRNYDTYITRDLLAEIDSTLRTIPTREGRGLAGMSMGGFGALQLTLRYPQLFSAAASHAGVTAPLLAGPTPYARDKVELVTDPTKWGPGGAATDWMLGIFGRDLARWQSYDPPTLVQKLAGPAPAIYLDCGTEDSLLGQTQYLHDILTERGIAHELHIVEGGKHDFDFARTRGAYSLAFLAAHLTKPQG